jgi:hypothetical protein
MVCLFSGTLTNDEVEDNYRPIFSSLSIDELEDLKKRFFLAPSCYMSKLFFFKQNIVRLYNNRNFHVHQVNINIDIIKRNEHKNVDYFVL